MSLMHDFLCNFQQVADLSEILRYCLCSHFFSSYMSVFTWHLHRGTLVEEIDCGVVLCVITFSLSALEDDLRVSDFFSAYITIVWGLN